MLQSSTTSDDIPLPDKQEYAKFYALQDNNICQQENAKLRIVNLIKIFKSFSKKVEQWKEESITFDGEHQNKIADYKSTWELLHLSTCSIEKFMEDISNIIGKLETVKGSISNPDKNQRLKTKIDEARAEIDSLDQEIKELKHEKNRLDEKISASRKKSWTDPRNCIDAQARLDNLTGRQDSRILLLDGKQATLKRRLDRFNSAKKTLYQESKTHEIERCQQLQSVAKKLFEVFSLQSNDLDQLSETCKAEKSFQQISEKYDATNDFELWEATQFPSDTAKLKRSRSKTKKTSPGENQ